MAFPADYTLLAKLSTNPALTGSGSQPDHKALITGDSFGALKDFIFTNTENGGGDVRYSTDLAGANQLPVDVIEHITTTKVCSHRVPLSVNDTVATDFYIWGKNTGDTQPLPTDQFGRNAVYTDLSVVAHLNETPSSANNHYVNSTGGTNGTAPNSAEPNTTNIYGLPSTKLESSSEQSVEYPVTFTNNTLTISGWAKADDLVEDQRFIFLYNADATAGQRFVGGLWIDVGDGGIGWAASTRNTADQALTIGLDNSDAATNWQRVTYFVDDSTISVYVNGQLTGSTLTTGTSLASTTKTIQVGHIWNLEPTGNFYFDGSVSSVLVANNDRRNYLLTEFNNENEPNNFISATAVATGSSLTLTSTMPSMDSTLGLNQFVPVNSIGIGSLMPSMASSATLNILSPEFDSAINSEMPSMTSTVSMSVFEVGYDSSINSTMPSMFSAVSLTVGEPVDLSTQISSVMPSMNSLLRMTNGDIQTIGNVTASFKDSGINVKYKLNEITVNFK